MKIVFSLILSVLSLNSFAQNSDISLQGVDIQKFVPADADAKIKSGNLHTSGTPSTAKGPVRSSKFAGDTSSSEISTSRNLPPTSVVTKSAVQVEFVDPSDKNIAPPSPSSRNKETSSISSIVSTAPAVAIQGKSCGFNHIAEEIRKDLNTLSVQEQAQTRYLSLYHLTCLEDGAEQIQTATDAINKAINSLSWNKDIYPLVAIDREKSILRLRLRNYHRVSKRTDQGIVVNYWNSSIWQVWLDQEPYHKLVSDRTVADVQLMTGGQFPFLRGDWFVKFATHTPLYEQVLGINSDIPTIEYLLGVDVEADIRNRQVERAGFDVSGVSKSNRVIERHRTDWGAYWLSYDFKPSETHDPAKDIKINPLGPRDGVAKHFSQDGGEYIFNLPNGLQAYVLSNATGKLLAKGPLEVVSDKSQDDFSVHNANSCMGCHSGGIIEKPDDIKKIVNQNSFSRSQEETLDVNQIYTNADVILKTMTEDQNRFKAAMGKLNIAVNGNDPVRATTKAYEERIDINKASAEFGISINQFRGLLSLPAFSNILGTMTVDKGDISRDELENIFREQNANLIQIITEQNAGTSAVAQSTVNAKQTQAMSYILKVCAPNHENLDYKLNIKCIVSNYNQMINNEDFFNTLQVNLSEREQNISRRVFSACVKASGLDLSDKHDCVVAFISTARNSAVDDGIYRNVCSALNSSDKRANCQAYYEQNTGKN